MLDRKISLSMLKRIKNILKQKFYKNRIKLETNNRDFPGGTVVKNPPANAGDTGSIPGPGRSHMPWSNEAREPQLLSSCATTTEPMCLEPVLRNKRSHHNEKPTHRSEE